MTASAPTPPWHLTWQKGGTASFLTVADDAVSLRSSIPSPPGSRIDGALVEGGNAVRVKIHRSKVQPDGSFLLEGRLLDATREDRERILALARFTPAPGST